MLVKPTPRRRHVTVPATAALGVAGPDVVVSWSARGCASARLDLGLTGTADHPATTVPPARPPACRDIDSTPAAQPRQHVLHLSQRLLALPLPAGGMLGKDVEIGACGQ